VQDLTFAVPHLQVIIFLDVRNAFVVVHVVVYIVFRPSMNPDPFGL
jgi:hypothetical protein